MGLLKDTRVIAFDSGATWLVKGVEIVTDPVTGERFWREWGLSRAEWRNQREDEKRLKLTTAWCADLRAPGGEFAQLTAQTRNTTDPAAFRQYCLNAHGALLDDPDGDLLEDPLPGAHRAILHEKLKYRWADAAFRTWSRGQAIMHSFWARVKAGRHDDGTAGVTPIILYGNASFSATGPGRHSAPTTSMRPACVTACGVSWVRDADEHRSTKCCSGCGQVLALVYAPTPQRVLEANTKRLEKQAQSGYGLARPAYPRRKVRGMLLCRNPACSNGFVHRDTDAAKLILLNALIKELHGVGVDCMLHIRHHDPKVALFKLEKRGVEVEVGGGGGI